MALHFGAAKLTQRIQLLVRFHTFGSCCDPARIGYPDHRLHDGKRILILSNLFGKAAINLDLINRKALQIGERGVAGAEIVHRDPHADAPKLIQDRHRLLVIMKQESLGNLDLQSLRR